MDFRKMTVEELENKFAEMQAMQQTAAEYVSKIDELISGLSNIRQQLKKFSNGQNTLQIVPKVSEATPESVSSDRRREFGGRRKRIAEILKNGQHTTRSSYLWLVEQGEVPSIDTEEGQKEYGNHRSIIGYMLKDGEIKSIDGKQRNCTWEYVGLNK